MNNYLKNNKWTKIKFLENEYLVFKAFGAFLQFSFVRSFQKYKAQLWEIKGSAAPRLAKYTKEILKNAETGYLSLRP